MQKKVIKSVVTRNRLVIRVDNILVDLKSFHFHLCTFVDLSFQFTQIKKIFTVKTTPINISIKNSSILQYPKNRKSSLEKAMVLFYGNSQQLSQPH